MPVVISPNLKRTSEKIDQAGNIYSGRNEYKGNVNDVGYTPTAEEMKAAVEKAANPPVPVEVPKSDSSLSELINKKVADAVDKIIAKKIEEALKNL